MIYCIVGPTGVGKTKLGVALAKELNGEVISGDSMQIYKQMDIGTAKVTEEEMDGITHHLINVKNPDETYNVKEFQDTVRGKIEEIENKAKAVIIVGGTGLYIKAALYDYTFTDTVDDNHVDINHKYQDYSNEDLYHHLESIDKEAAKILHPNNRRRVLRAIEIYEQTGHKKSEMEASQKHLPLYDVKFIGLTLDREVLYDRINKRVDQMISNGLEKEVTDLYNQGLTLDHQSMKAIGYKEWFNSFNHQLTLEEVVELIKKNSRNYAKRQYTWFRNQFDVTWYNVHLEDFDLTVKEVLNDIQ